MLQRFYLKSMDKWQKTNKGKLHWKITCFEKKLLPVIQNYRLAQTNQKSCQKHKPLFPDDSEISVVVTGSIWLLSFGSRCCGLMLGCPSAKVTGDWKSMVFFVVLFQHQPTSHDQWDYVVVVFNIYAFSKLMCQFLKVSIFTLQYDWGCAIWYEFTAYVSFRRSLPALLWCILSFFTYLKIVFLLIKNFSQLFSKPFIS